MRYLTEPKNKLYVNWYGFLSFTKSMGNNLSNKFSQTPLESAKRSATVAIKPASKRAIQKTAEATSYLIGNKIADKITSVFKKSPPKLQNDNSNRETEVSKERYISPQKKTNYWWIKVSIII